MVTLTGATQTDSNCLTSLTTDLSTYHSHLETWALCWLTSYMMADIYSCQVTDAAAAAAHWRHSSACRCSQLVAPTSNTRQQQQR